MSKQASSRSHKNCLEGFWRHCEVAEVLFALGADPHTNHHISEAIRPRSEASPRETAAVLRCVEPNRSRRYERRRWLSLSLHSRRLIARNWSVFLSLRTESWRLGALYDHHGSLNSPACSCVSITLPFHRKRLSVSFIEVLVSSCNRAANFHGDTLPSTLSCARIFPVQLMLALGPLLTKARSNT
jgi:hypothetical protein